jgi:type IV pilus assembly protein PilX
VALFISLVLLLLLTIIGVSAVQTTSLELRMARNDNDTLLAFQSAESALRDA